MIYLLSYVVNLEALGPGSVLMNRGNGESLGEEECLQPRLTTVTESILTIVFGSEFQTAGAEHRKACIANVVIVDGGHTSWWPITGQVVDSGCCCGNWPQ